MCELCNGTKIAKYMTGKITCCPACDIGGFQEYLSRKNLKEIVTMCKDCHEPTEEGRPRCLPCHNVWKEQYTLCDICNNRQHQNKYVMCYLCNTKKKFKNIMSS